MPGSLIHYLYDGGSWTPLSVLYDGYDHHMCLEQDVEQAIQ